ncbi:hypothetical protein EDB89DRAFT_856372 [Lactarius sanguifluus]|nr:hypothetical protein EDB89DRAFT_856372 [Lactarius sanguifluus]
MPLALVYTTMTLLPCFFSNSYHFTSPSGGSREYHSSDVLEASAFRHSPYVGRNSWRDDCGLRDRAMICRRRFRTNNKNG